jgi:hypothetical protein
VSVWRWQRSFLLSNLDSWWWPLSLATNPNQPSFHGILSQVPNLHHSSHSRLFVVMIFRI